MHPKLGVDVAEIVRVARDKGAVIVKTESEFVRISTDGEAEKATASTLSELTAGGSWRRAVRSDQTDFAEAAVIATGKVFSEDETVTAAADRAYRVPPTVRRSIADALDAYSALLSDGDREIASRLAKNTSVQKSDIEWMHRFFENIEKAQSLHGGKRGQNWARKVLASPEDETLVAGGFEDESVFDYEANNPNILFVAAGDDFENGLVNALYMIEYDDVDSDDFYGNDGDLTLYRWEMGEFVPFTPELGELEAELLIEIDPMTAKSLAHELDAAMRPVDAAPEDIGIGEFTGIDVRDFYPEERNLFDLASSEIDFESLDRFAAIIADATGYSPVERSQNAQRQPRAQGGRFGEGSPEEPSNELEAFAKAKLPEELPLVEDPNALIEDYLARIAGTVSEDDVEEPVATEGDAPAPTPVTAAGPGEGGVDPLYLAIVDSTDKTAVMDCIAITPGEDGTAQAWRREAGKWAHAPEAIDDIRGDTPPPLVELEDEGLIKDVLAQIDESDGQTSAAEDEAVAASAWELAGPSAEKRDEMAKKGQALPDGSYPIANESDLKKAIKAFGRAKDKAAAKRHIKKRARALGRTDLVPEEWKTAAVFDDVHLEPIYGPFGEQVAMIAAGVPGVADTAEDFAAVRRLKNYWARGAGAAKIRWGTPGDLTRCHRHLTKYLKNSGHAWGYCNNLHKEIFGIPNPESGRR